MARALARIADAYDRNNTIRHHDDDNRFENTTDDITLISTISNDKPKPVFLTADTSQLRRPSERAALRDSAMSIVFFKSRFNSMPFRDQCLKILYSWDSIMLECGTCKRPTAFEITSRVKSEKVARLRFTSEL